MTETRCTDGCGAAVVNPLACGWYLLEASNRWRCPKCARELADINQRFKENPNDRNLSPGGGIDDPAAP